MMRRRPILIRAALVGAALCALAPSARAAGEDSCDVRAPRVVAVGDVHGAYDSFLAILREAGLVDERARWSGGTAHLVQLGDLLDRGSDARRVLDLLVRLEGEARRAGGRVHALLGNHEVMNLLGDLRYVQAAEYESFREAGSQERRQRFLDSATRRARESARAAGEAFDESGFRARFLARTPLGFVERTAALTPEGRYGRWLRERPGIARVNGVVFVHGGLTPEVAALGCAGIARTVQREITVDEEKTRAAPLSTLVAGENGPLWYRGLARGDEAALAPALEQVLQAVGARALVIGHTVTGDGRLRSRFGGRVLMIDAGMTAEYGGHAAALEIAGDGAMTALYPGRREPVAGAAAAALGDTRPQQFSLAGPAARD